VDKSHIFVDKSSIVVESSCKKYVRFGCNYQQIFLKMWKNSWLSTALWIDFVEEFLYQI